MEFRVIRRLGFRIEEDLYKEEVRSWGVCRCGDFKGRESVRFLSVIRFRFKLVGRESYFIM